MGNPAGWEQQSKVSKLKTGLALFLTLVIAGPGCRVPPKACKTGDVKAQKATSTRGTENARRRLKKKWRFADRLARSGKSKEALKEYLSVFEKSRDVPALAGARGTFLLSSIIRLSASYPPALDAIKKIRDDLEARIRRGRTTRHMLTDFRALNRCLDERQRNIQLHDALIGKKHAPTQKEFASLIWKDLARAKRYEDLAGVARDIAYRVSSGLVRSQLSADFGNADLGEDLERRLIASKVTDGIIAYRVLTILGEHRLANRLKDWLLRFRHELGLYQELISVLLAQNKSKIARSLLEEAQKHFPCSNTKKLEELVGRKAMR